MKKQQESVIVILEKKNVQLQTLMSSSIFIQM